MMELKRISIASVPRALEMGERYRLLNEPDQAASICRDILAVDPRNQDAVRTLLLALTDQFGGKGGASVHEAESVLNQLTGEYDRLYYHGVIYERWGRSKLDENVPVHIAGDWLRRAMHCYEEAEKNRPLGDDAAILRWNTCARLLARVPGIEAKDQDHLVVFD